MIKITSCIILILSFFMACSKKPPIQKIEPKKNTQYTREEEKSIARDFFLRARKLEFEKKPKIALEFYETAFK